MRIEHDQGLSELITSSQETKLCGGFTFTEGPVWVAAEQCLLFSDIPSNRMHRWRPGASEAELYREPSGHSNGLTVDGDGNVIACEHSGRRVSRAPYNGAAETLVEHYEGRRLNSPNDVVTHSGGAIYFTDPTYGLPRPGGIGGMTLGDPDARQELDVRGVYRVATDGGVTLVAGDFAQPNGLAFSPDQSLLYIGDSQGRVIRLYGVQPDGSLTGGELFVDMREEEAQGAPDGMKVDEDGRLWTTGGGGVWVVEPDGHRLGVFELEEHAANLTFGGANFPTLYRLPPAACTASRRRCAGSAPARAARERCPRVP